MFRANVIWVDFRFSKDIQSSRLSNRKLQPGRFGVLIRPVYVGCNFIAQCVFMPSFV